MKNHSKILQSIHFGRAKAAFSLQIGDCFKVANRLLEAFAARSPEAPEASLACVTQYPPK